MLRGPFFQDIYSPQFSGHETFPLRYGWLKKVYDHVFATQNKSKNRSICWDNSAIAHFGVGKNMVSSMRHWAKVTGIVEEPQKTNAVKTTCLGDRLFGQDGFDPYMESPTTLWLIHWQLAARPEKTTWFWAFNHFSGITFNRDPFTQQLEHLIKERHWPRTSSTTIRNDIACFIRTYVARQPSGKLAEHDGVPESPLTELGLIKAIGKKDGFRFVRGPKCTLHNGMFIYALLDFWLRHSRTSTTSSTLSFERVAYAPGSPGRVFALDENDVVDRLAQIDDFTNGALRWSETAGLKQVINNSEINDDLIFECLSSGYAAKNR